MYFAYSRSVYVGENMSALLVNYSKPMAYRYAKLLKLGPLGEDVITDELLQAFEMDLTPDEIDAGGAWAQSMFKQRFESTYRGEIDFGVCD